MKISFRACSSICLDERLGSEAYRRGSVRWEVRNLDAEFIQPAPFTMTLAILGATGSVGRHVVSQALERGHAVSALVRSPDKLRDQHPDTDASQVAAIEGDALDPDAVARTVRGSDAVVVTLGAGRSGRVRAEGTRNAVGAMQAHGVQRLVVQSTLGTGESWDNLNWFWKWVMFRGLLRPAFADHEEQERVVRASGLAWTIIRPGAFTDGPLTGQYRHGFARDDRSITLKISRADVAHFVLGQIADDTYVRRCPGLSY